MRRGIFLLPNVVTTANLFCGFFSITRSIAGEFEFAAFLIIFATFLDFLDGRIARLTKSQSGFGVEYDSLSDLTTFCLAPAILAYLFGLQEFGRFGIAACFLFFGCGALRLARFNVQASTIEKYDFQGLPSPTAGGMIAAYVLFYQDVVGFSDRQLFILLGLTVGLGLLMVSNVRYRSFKRVSRASFLFLVLIVALFFLIASKPKVMFFVVASVYVLIGIVEWIWKSPQKIRGIKDLWVRFYNERREDLIYNDEGEEEGDEGRAEENGENSVDDDNNLRVVSSPHVISTSPPHISSVISTRPGGPRRNP